MPAAWVRGAIAVRANSLVRGHSAVRWEVLEGMVGVAVINNCMAAIFTFVASKCSSVTNS